MEQALIQCLNASISPDTNAIKQAEVQLKQATRAPGFVNCLVVKHHTHNVYKIVLHDPTNDETKIPIDLVY